MTNRVRLFVGLILTLAPALTMAQVPSTAVPLAPPFLTGCDAEPALAQLTALYNRGDWSAFQTQARVLLDALRLDASAERKEGSLGECVPTTTVPSPVRSALDYVTRHVALTWIGQDALGKTQLMRAVVHWPEPEAFSA